MHPSSLLAAITTGILAFGNFTACSKDPNAPKPESGTLELSWQVGLGIACNDPALGNPISAVSLVASQGGEPVSTATFTCALGAAGLSLPIGEYDLSLAENATTPRFGGARTKVVVDKQPGQKVNVVLYKNPGPTGSLDVKWALPTALPCAALGIEKIHIDLIKDKTVQAFGGDFDCNGSATLKPVPLGDYTLYAEGRNAAGHSLYRGQLSVAFDGSAGAAPIVQLAP
ncbi:MAG: hypothetical protein HYY84_17490 [Deltaproteobacteria bacterium]|nr:hypothetical protein [Deltaproteobacteria bacterium]